MGAEAGDVVGTFTGRCAPGICKTAHNVLCIRSHLSLESLVEFDKRAYPYFLL